MARKKDIINDEDVHVEFEIVGDIDIYKFFSNMAMEIVDKINNETIK